MKYYLDKGEMTFVEKNDSWKYANQYLNFKKANIE